MKSTNEDYKSSVYEEEDEESELFTFKNSLGEEEVPLIPAAGAYGQDKDEYSESEDEDEQFSLDGSDEDMSTGFDPDEDQDFFFTRDLGSNLELSRANH